MIQLTRVAQTGTFSVYNLEGAQVTVRDAEGIPFLPEGVAITLNSDGAIKNVHLIGHAPLSTGREVHFRDFTREDVTTDYTGDDMAQHVELDLVAEILTATMRADGHVVDTITA